MVAVPTVGALVALALLDSTSFGTLGIPVFLLIQARVRVATLLLYLCAIGVFYWAVGLVLAFGAHEIHGFVAALDDSRPLDYVQLALGIGLFALSYRFDKKRIAQRRERDAAAGTGPGRRERWRATLTEGTARPGVVVAVALAAGLIEVASMLPYLGAVGIITQAQLPAPAVAGVLGTYVVVMIAPALVLLALRLIARRAVEPTLARLGAWIDRNSEEMLGWILGGVGILLTLDAASRIYH